MDDPYFKIKNYCKSGGIRLYCSNYSLYSDMSGRVNNIYRSFSPRIEVYSIDESFLDLTDVHPLHRTTLAKDMRSTVRKWTGIPTCVGIGPTKTLAKLANHIAKVTPGLGGVCDLSDERDRAAWLKRTPLKEIWGVGPATARKLEAFGCRNVGDVRDLDPRRARNGMTVVGERLVRELRGIPCLDLDSLAPTRKGCAVTRSFSNRVRDLPSMEMAVSTHAARFYEKLRREGLGTDRMLASSGWVKDRAWSTKFDMRSPRYTTGINELPAIQAA